MKLTETRDLNFQGRISSVREKLKGSDSEIAAYVALAQLWFDQGFEIGVWSAHERFGETLTQTAHELGRTI